MDGSSLKSVASQLGVGFVVMIVVRKGGVHDVSM